MSQLKPFHSVRDTDHERKQPAQGEHRRRVSTPDRLGAACASDRHDLVHHHLGRCAKSGFEIVRHGKPMPRRIAECRCQKADQNAFGLGQKVGLDDQRGTRFSVISRNRHGDDVTPLHRSVSSQSAACSIKSSASASSGAPISDCACRCASSAKPGACGSGTQSLTSFKPLARCKARYRWNLLRPFSCCRAIPAPPAAIR